MSKRTQQSQHRPSRDTAKSKELADLRRENHKLKKQVAQGRKTVQRVVDSNDMFRGVDSTATPVNMEAAVLTRETLQKAFDLMNRQPSGPPQRIVPPGVCHECGGSLKKLELGPKVVEVCSQCGWRRVVKTVPI
jgi:DNA-directed RNA polymerase subunit RPC12/RpoP